jgi:hypothetical protein
VLPNAYISKDSFIIIKSCKQFLQLTNSLTSMALKLCKKEKVHQCMDSLYNVWWIPSTRNREINNKPKQNGANLLVFLAWNTRKWCYSLCKEPNLIVWWDYFAPCINCCLPKDTDKLLNQMFYHSLQQLMKDVGHNWDKIISKQKCLPEGMEERPQTSIIMCAMKCCNITIS